MRCSAVDLEVEVALRADVLVLLDRLGEDHLRAVRALHPQAERDVLLLAEERRMACLLTASARCVAAQGADGGRAVGLSEDGGAGDEHVARPPRWPAGAVVGSMPPSISMSPGVAPRLQRRAPSSSTSRDEGLAAEAREDGHHEDEAHVVEVGLGPLEGRVGVQHDAGPRPLGRGSWSRAGVDVVGRLDVDRDPVGARVAEGLHVLRGVRDHQVAVEHGVGHGSDALHERRAEGDVGHEVAVHHVEVEQVGAAVSTSRISSPRRVKSAERIEGAILTSRAARASVIDPPGTALEGRDSTRSVGGTAGRPPAGRRRGRRAGRAPRRRPSGG